ncbi:unnamed protein product (mitochondrion) [Plasmodiophora brassicae]|uniref:Uncharacterized protein n=1 Tax=Plasmodiophora brassicae TaxID=37360 RepID=A0A3P3Y2Y5_PLABS|nr:unnamed protein product [Plasmodiophora brassicae]
MASVLELYFLPRSALLEVWVYTHECAAFVEAFERTCCRVMIDRKPDDADLVDWAAENPRSRQHREAEAKAHYWAIWRVDQLIVAGVYTSSHCAQSFPLPLYELSCLACRRRSPRRTPGAKSWRTALCCWRRQMQIRPLAVIREKGSLNDGNVGKMAGHSWRG